MGENEMRRVESVNELRKRWLEAVADDSEGLDPDEVFDLLEAKYGRMAYEAAKQGDLTS